MIVFHIGEIDSEYVSIEVPDSEIPKSLKPYEDWVAGFVIVDVAGFKNRYKTSFIVLEIAKLLEDVRRLSDDLQSAVTFEALEHGLELRLSPTNRGRIQVYGEARPDPVETTRLVFELDLDQSYLARPIELLSNALRVLRSGAP